MNIIQRIAKNTVALICAQMINALVTFILAILIARLLGDVVFGQYSFALAFSGLFVISAELGYTTLLIREIARKATRAEEYFNNVAGIRVVLSLVAFAIMILLIATFDYPEDIKHSICIFAAYMLVTSFLNNFKGLFRAFERMEYDALITISTNIFRGLVGIFVLLQGYGLFALALVFLGSSLAGLILGLYICQKKFVKINFCFNLHFFRESLKSALPLSITGISILLYTTVDTIMLSFFADDAVVGWYNAAYQIVLGFKPIPQLFMGALFPLMSRSFVSAKGSFLVASKTSFKFLLTLGLLLSVLMFSISDSIILIIYGNDFLNSILAFKILCWDIVLYFIWFNGSFILIAMNNQVLWVKAAVSTAVLNILLNLFLIPQFSFIGAAVATIMAEAVCAILVLFFIYKEIHFSVDLSILLKLTGAGVIAFLPTIFLIDKAPVAFVAIAVILGYTVSLLFLGVFTDHEKKIFRSLCDTKYIPHPIKMFKVILNKKGNQ